MRSEPGTCKDRDILRFEPQKLIEGCLIAGYAVNAHVCYIYIRGEYVNEGLRLQEAIDQAYKKKTPWKRCCRIWMGFRYPYSLWCRSIHLRRRNSVVGKY